MIVFNKVKYPNVIEILEKELINRNANQASPHNKDVVNEIRQAISALNKKLKQ